MRYVLLLALAGCSKGDDCQRFYAKSRVVLDTLAEKAGQKAGADLRTSFVEDCRSELAKGRRDPVMDCVLGAATDDAVNECWKKAFEDYAKPSKSMEAFRAITYAQSAMSEYASREHKFPVAKTGLVPATPCCAQPGKACKPDPAQWSGPWEALRIRPNDSFLFQYSYDSDGTSMHLVVTGDPECDGHTRTFGLRGTLENGWPKFVEEGMPTE
jgi:hypothetical protein